MNKFAKRFRKIRLDRARKEAIIINGRLLSLKMDSDEILDFWEDCLAEAEIRHNLPPCKCKDVNQCDTWCQAKGRFTVNPPKD